MPADFDFPDGATAGPTVAMIGPGSTVHSAHIDIPAPLLDHAAAGNQFLYFWGWIDYDDVIDGTPRHRTEFCFQIRKQQGMASFWPHGRFNGADNECLQKPTPYKT
jgi:hypothetical protein